MTFCPEPSRVHSAHINQDVEVYYRWHALHGRKVRQLYAERRSGRDVAIIEAEPGVAIVIYGRTAATPRLRTVATPALLRVASG